MKTVSFICDLPYQRFQSTIPLLITYRVDKDNHRFPKKFTLPSIRRLKLISEAESRISPPSCISEVALVLVRSHQSET